MEKTKQRVGTNYTAPKPCILRKTVNLKLSLILILAGYVTFCGWLVAESGLFKAAQSAEKPGCILLQNATTGQIGNAPETLALETPQVSADQVFALGAEHASPNTVTLGSVDPNSPFNFQLELSSKGAAIAKATFSRFDDRDYKNPQPLVILSAVPQADGSEILSMANADFVFVDHGQKIPLDKLHWESHDVEKAADGSQRMRFEAVIKDNNTGEALVKLTKTFKVVPNSYMLDCDITVENLSAVEHKVRFNLAGPAGIGREAARADMRKAITAFANERGQVISARVDTKKLRKAGNSKEINNKKTVKDGVNFLWAAVANKYFAAIVVPLADGNKNYCDWVPSRKGRFYNPDGDPPASSGDETIGVDLETTSTLLPRFGQAGNAKTYKFQLYLGPKDKSLFDKNEQYRDLGFVQTIDFLGCCCPTSIISPLAFGILATMKWMHGFIPNYGVVIIILVFLIRIALHPLTKKSQITMRKMSKLAPKVEEVKKKYANNKAEMNKQLMAVYKEQGASPVMGMLPMMVQMPILIALWSAIYASIDLRGAAFLPVWITDLSAPDALIRFTAVTLPLFGKLESFNLLPILMGVAMYLQQSMMPSQASANPQAAQQQKMMKIIFPLMLPLILYKGPSGVNLYFMASTFAGVIEQYVIRKHLREKEEAEEKGLVAATSKTGGKVKKKKPKPFYKT